MKTCPYCKEDVHNDAIKCRHCHSMLLPIEQPANLSDDSRVTYIFDRDLVRFAKFSVAVLAVFLIVGSYLFGFKLESALEKVRSTQEDMKAAQEKLSLTQKELEAALSMTQSLKSDVEKVLADAQQYVTEISAQRTVAVEIVTSMRELSPQQQAELKEVKEQQPEKARGDVRGKWWKAGSTIRIRFLDGDAATHKQVKAIASEWTKYANLQFKFVASGHAEIRISFDKNDGAWSYLGTDALVIPQNIQTMNLGFVNKQTVLNQFGHALGLINEHQNPKANIHWNRALIIREMSGPPNNWTTAEIEHNVFEKASADKYPDYREFDPESIMAKSFPPSWTGGVKIGGGEDLSESDKAFIAKLYPH